MIVRFSIIKEGDGGIGQEVYEESVQVRIFCEDPKRTAILVQDGTGAYVQTKTEVMGSYLMFTMEQPGTFRLTNEQNYSTLRGVVIRVVVGICVVLVILLIVVFVTKEKKRRADKAEREQIESNNL